MGDTLAYYIAILKKDFENYCFAELNKWGITKGLLFFVIYIGKNPGCLPKNVSKTLRADAGHTTRSVMRLTELELVRSEVNEKDKRQKSLFLTEKGEEAFQKILHLFEEWDDLITEDWTEQEKILIKNKMRSMVMQIKEKYYV